MNHLEKSIAIVFDDHLLFAESFSALLERLGLFRTVRAFNDEHEFIRFLAKHYDVPLYLFLDYYLPENNALTLINDTRRLNKKAHIIVISSITTPAVIRHILTYQPHGFISKASGIDVILDCLRKAERTKPYLCPIIQQIVETDSIRGNDIPFSARELEMLQLFALGMSIAQTADQTNLSKHTIVSHRRKMMNKVKAKSITELLAYARKNGLI